MLTPHTRLHARHRGLAPRDPLCLSPAGGTCARHPWPVSLPQPWTREDQRPRPVLRGGRQGLHTQTRHCPHEGNTATLPAPRFSHPRIIITLAPHVLSEEALCGTAPCEAALPTRTVGLLRSSPADAATGAGKAAPSGPPRDSSRAPSAHLCACVHVCMHAHACTCLHVCTV